jgi:hypothetical protein
MRKLVIALVAVITMGAIMGTGTVPSFAQGQAGLNGGTVAGPGYHPWTGPANGMNNPISGSPQDPAMQPRP